ncbi:MAG: hypothetical protein ACP5UV_01230 [Thermoplasmata archaeon]
MDDIETLKLIKEKETSSEEELKQLKADQDKLISEVQKKNEEEIQKKKDEFELDYNMYVESAVKEAEEKGQSIIEDARNSAKNMNLNLDDESIKKMVLETLEQYLRE